MQTACATKRQQCKLTTVKAALNRNAPEGPLHVCVGDGQHSLGGDDGCHSPAGHLAHFVCKGRNRFSGTFFVERKLSSEQPRAAEVTKQDVCVSYSWQKRTAITCWTRIGSR